MKKIALVAAIVAVSATATFAGGLDVPMMEPMVVVEETSASSAGGFVVPLILLLLVAAAIANN